MPRGRGWGRGRRRARGRRWDMVGLPPLPQMPRGGVWMVGSRHRTAWARAGASRSGQSGPRCSRSCTAVAGSRSHAVGAGAGVRRPCRGPRGGAGRRSVLSRPRGPGGAGSSGRKARKSRLDIRWIVARIIEPRTALRPSGGRPGRRAGSRRAGSRGRRTARAGPGPACRRGARSLRGRWRRRRSSSHWRWRVARFWACRLNFDMADLLPAGGSSTRKPDRRRQVFPCRAELTGSFASHGVPGN